MSSGSSTESLDEDLHSFVTCDSGKEDSSSRGGIYLVIQLPQAFLYNYTEKIKSPGFKSKIKRLPALMYDQAVWEERQKAFPNKFEPQTSSTNFIEEKTQTSGIACPVCNATILAHKNLEAPPLTVLHTARRGYKEIFGALQGYEAPEEIVSISGDLAAQELNLQTPKKNLVVLKDMGGNIIAYRDPKKANSYFRRNPDDKCKFPADKVLGISRFEEFLLPGPQPASIRCGGYEGRESLDTQGILNEAIVTNGSALALASSSSLPGTDSSRNELAVARAARAATRSMKATDGGSLAAYSSSAMKSQLTGRSKRASSDHLLKPRRGSQRTTSAHEPQRRSRRLRGRET